MLKVSLVLSTFMETKERILKSADDLFFRYGVKSVTMDDIASHLGMSKKTIYHFFKDKDELLSDFAKSFVNRNVGAFEHVCKASHNAIDEIFCVMKHLRAMMLQMNPKLFFDLQKYYPHAWQQLRDFREKHVAEMIQKNLEKGISQELYRSDINIIILAKLRLEEIEMAMNPTIFPMEKFNTTQVQLTLFEHFLYGICTLKGHKLINKYKQIKEDE
ncbi:MAG: TetR/AcrR family transcriptional regulator [Bacteroidetes bacterium]|nr:TetR/AcrR family transcriptional regulator [Bacteroidota bacterium]